MIVLILFGSILLLFAAVYALRGWWLEPASPPPATLGLQNGRLGPCRSIRNCASTYETQAPAAMQPIPYTGSATDAQAKLLNVLGDMQRMTIVKTEPGYIHAVSRSPNWGFIDDNEFVIADGRINFKAAGRLGVGDMGANRARIELIARRMGSE